MHRLILACLIGLTALGAHAVGAYPILRLDAAQLRALAAHDGARPHAPTPDL